MARGLRSTTIALSLVPDSSGAIYEIFGGVRELAIRVKHWDTSHVQRLTRQPIYGCGKPAYTWAILSRIEGAVVDCQGRTSVSIAHELIPGWLPAYRHSARRALQIENCCRTSPLP